MRAATTGECGARSSGAASGSGKAVNATVPAGLAHHELRGGGVHGAAPAQGHHAVEARGGDLAEGHGDRADRPHAVRDLGQRVGRQPHPARIGRLEAQHLQLAVHLALAGLGVERRAVEQRPLAAPGDPLLPRPEVAHEAEGRRPPSSRRRRPRARGRDAGSPRLAFLEPSIGSTITSGLRASAPKSTEPRSSLRTVNRAPSRWRRSSWRKTASSAAASISSVRSPPLPIVPVSRARSAVVGAAARMSSSSAAAARAAPSQSGPGRVTGRILRRCSRRTSRPPSGRR